MLFRSTEVVIDSYRDEPNISKISATIFVARESQKAIVLGHKGEAIKKLGTESRKQIEEFIGRKVFLELTVKVREKWRDSDRDLERFGY